jgi:hypothetical protein
MPVFPPKTPEIRGSDPELAHVHDAFEAVVTAHLPLLRRDDSLSLFSLALERMNGSRGIKFYRDISGPLISSDTDTVVYFIGDGGLVAANIGSWGQVVPGGNYAFKDISGNIITTAFAPDLLEEMAAKELQSGPRQADMAALLRTGFINPVTSRDSGYNRLVCSINGYSWELKPRNRSAFRCFGSEEKSRELEDRTVVVFRGHNNGQHE